MLFKRFLEKVRRQDWFSIWLEIVAVVLGVFLALQAENWNQWRIERIEERDYLLRLHSDIGASIDTLKLASDYMTLHANRANVVLRSLKQCKIDQSDQLDFANGLFQLGNIMPPYLADGTIQEMRATGKEPVIRSPEVRRNLNNLLATRQYYIGFFQLVADRMTPHVVYVQSQVSFRIDQSNAGTQEIAWEALEFDLHTLCNDPRFFTAVSAARTYSYDTVFWSTLELRRLEALMDVLQDEINRLGISSDEG